MGISVPTRMEPGKPAACGIFLSRKINSVFFLRPKIFAGPGDPDFFVKNRNCRKIHDGEKWR
jgi:hypothetical protein